MGAVDLGPRRPDRTLLLLAALTVAAGVLRFATIDVQSLWGDEAATVLLLRKGLGDMLSSLPGSESAPPLYYVLAWCWAHVFGTGAIGVRSFSALVGTLTVPVAYLAGSAASRRVGLWAAAVAACSPLTFYYAQETRAYALLVLLAGLGLAVWQRAMDDPSRGRLAAWAAVGGLSLLTHYFALFLVVPEAVALVRRVGLRRVAGELLGLAVVGAALLPLALRQRRDGKSAWIETTSLASRMGQVPKQFLVGLDGPAEILTALAAAALAAAAVALLLRRGDARERRVAAGAAWVAGVGLALPLALSVTKAVDVFNGRNVVEAWVPAAVVVAAGLGAARARWAGAALGTALCALSLGVVGGVLADPGVQRDDWRGVSEALRAASPSSERLVAGPANEDGPFAVYLPGSRQAGRSGTDATWRTRELALVALRVRRTARSSLPPPAPAHAPRGFRLMGRTTTKTYMVTLYAAPRPVAVRTRDLAADLGDPEASFAWQAAQRGAG